MFPSCEKLVVLHLRAPLPAPQLAARNAKRKRQLGMQQQQAALLAPGAAQARAQQQQQPVALPALQTYPKLDHEQTMPGLVYLACPANVG